MQKSVRRSRACRLSRATRPRSAPCRHQANRAIRSRRGACALEAYQQPPRRQRAARRGTGRTAAGRAPRRAALAADRLAAPDWARCRHSRSSPTTPSRTARPTPEPVVPLAVRRGVLPRAVAPRADARRSPMAMVWRVASSPTVMRPAATAAWEIAEPLNQSHRAVTAAERREAMAPDRTATALAHQNRREERTALVIQDEATPGQNRRVDARSRRAKYASPSFR